MSYSSKVIYEGDGVTTDFTVTFPYISTSHVSVFLDDVLQLSSMNYVWSGASTIQFNDAPADGSAIEIKRNTSPTSTLVDFTDGSTLRANDLDTAYLHNYYLGQEYADSFNELINQALINVATGAGIVETDTDEVIAALVNEMLADANAANLQARIADIDANAEAIITLGQGLQAQVNTLAQATAATVFVQASEPVPGVGGVPDPIPEGARWYDSDDNNKPYIYQSSAWVSIEDPRIGQAVADISVLQTDVNDNAAAIVTESLARSTQDTAFASQLALLGAQNGAQTAWIIDLDTVQITDGVESLADRFSTLQTNIDDNEALIIAEQTARANGDSANASSITALSATVDTKNQTFIQASAPTAVSTGDLWIDSDDGNKLYRWNGSAWVAIQDAAISGNASAITSLDTRVTTNEGDISSQASSITSISSSVTTLQGQMSTAQVDIVANTSAITSNDGDITTLYAKYGVTLNVDGYITGFAQNNDGSTGSFAILADKFAVVTPSTEWAASTAYSEGDMVRPTSNNGRVYRCSTAGTSGASEPSWPTTVSATVNDNTAVWTCFDDVEVQPFLIDGNTITMTGDVAINGSLLLNGTVVGSALVAGTIGSTQIGPNAITTTQLNANAVTADKISANAVTASKINVTNLAAVNADLGAITAGSITMDTAGFIQGGATAYDTGTGFWMGYDSSAYKFRIGNTTDNYMQWDGTTLQVIGDILVGEYSASSNAILSANTERTDTGTGFTRKKSFTVDRSGTVRVAFDMKRDNGIGQSNGWTPTEVRIYKNTTLQHTDSQNNGTYTTKTYDMSVSAGDEIHLDLQGGTYWNSGDLALEPMTGYIRNAQIQADVALTTGGSADLD